MVFGPIPQADKTTLLLRMRKLRTYLWHILLLVCHKPAAGSRSVLSVPPGCAEALIESTVVPET